MNATAYVRVSSKAQNFATQKHAIEQEAARRGDTIAEWRSEKRSGKKLARPELDRVRDDVRVGRVQRLYVFKLDRITRSGVADTYRVVDELRRGGCTLIAVADNLTITPASDDIQSEVLVFALGLAARLQRSAINENISAARERLESAGKSWGRPSRFTSTEVEKMVALKEQGLSIRQIAVKVHVPHSSVALALKRAAAA